MSQLNSDDFGDGEIGFEEATYEDALPTPGPPAPVYRQRGFSIYTVMLIISFVFLTIAAILAFVESGKY